MRDRCGYGVTLGQLDALFDHRGKREVSVPQLLEFLVASGEVVEKDGVYTAMSEAALAASEQPPMVVETGVTEDVTERHYRCLADSTHEFSILSKPNLEMARLVDCPVSVCFSEAELLGDNPAEVAKDLLKN